MNKIIILGATGFVGKNLVLYLKNSGIVIRSIGRNEMSFTNEFLKTDAIIHLAGKAHDLKKNIKSR